MVLNVTRADGRRHYSMSPHFERGLKRRAVEPIEGWLPSQAAVGRVADAPEPFMSSSLTSASSRPAAASLTPVPVRTPIRNGVAANAQSGRLTFSRSAATNFDGTAAFSDLGLESTTRSLAVSLDLKAGRDYSFSFYFPSGGPKVSLVDSRGRATAVNMAQGFKVATDGTYTLRFEASYSLRDAANFNNLRLNFRATLPRSSGDSRLDALLNGGTNQWWRPWDAVAVRGTERIGAAAALTAGSSATALTYSFLTSPPPGQSMTGFQEMTSAQKDAVRRAFATYAKLINVTFTEVSPQEGANISFGTNVQASSAGYANLPNASGVKDQAFLYLANNQATNNDAGMQDGGYGYLTLLHEIGHTLGLKHPGNYNAGGGGTPGPYLPASEDNRQKTIMAYSDNNFSRGVRATTPMLYDVAALQYLYGANKTASTATDGAFTFSAGQSPLQTLWSTNGTDRIDLSGISRSNVVNLNGGTYSSIDISAPATSVNYSGNQNVAIAFGAKIDRVKLSGTAGVSDTVTLNDAFNRGAFNVVESFDASVDRIGLRRGLFGALAAKNIQIGDTSTATSANSRIIVNRTTGEIFYDADGVGRRSTARKIAQYSAITNGSSAFSATNFSFVA
jgi:hypothetical protein